MSKEVKCTFSDQASASGNAGNGSNGKGNNGTNGVKTGDEAQGILYLVVLLAALGAGTVVVLRRRARQF